MSLNAVTLPNVRSLSMVEESRLLGDALRALRHERDELTALRTLDLYERRFPDGELHREAELARVDALLLVGRRVEALGSRRTIALPRSIERGRASDAKNDFDVALVSAQGDLAPSASTSTSAPRIFPRRKLRKRVGRTTLEEAAMTNAAQLLFTPFDEYLALESGSELKHGWINGLVYAMSRGTPEHGRLSAAIVRALPQTDERRVYSSDTLLYIERAQHSTYADASIVCGAILTRGAKDKNGRSLGEAIMNPRVVVEVLSKSTERRDRNERFILFQQLDSLEEYVLVSQDEPRIEVRRRGGRDWAFDVKVAGETILIHGADVDVDTLYR